MIADLTGSSDSQIRNSYSAKPPYLMGTEIYTQNVLIIADGQIVGAGQEADGTWSISVKVNHNEVLRYCHLKNRQFGLAYTIRKGIKIGDAKEYVRFEYCTTWQGNSKFPVRLVNYTFFRQDPTDILEGRYTVMHENAVPNQQRLCCARPDYYNDILQQEFGNNTGVLTDV